MRPDLAELSGVPKRVLTQAAWRRNRDRFPPDITLRLSWEEARIIRAHHPHHSPESLRGRKIQ